MKKLLLITVLSICTLNATSDDGSRLWLPAAQQCESSLTPSFKCYGVKPTQPSIGVAIDELKNAGITEDITLKIIKGREEPGSYHITGTDGAYTISATTPAGILYGTYDLIRRIQLNKATPTLTVDETPAYRLRMLDHWDNLDGSVERGYAGYSLWDWTSLPDSISPRYTDYARACASVGINASVLNNVNASPKMLDSEMLHKVKALADTFRPYGIKVFLSVNFASPKVIGGLPTADPLNADVQRWWVDKANEIYGLIPDFGGFLVKANSEGEPGPGDYGRSHSEGANMLADALAPHGGTILWRAFVYKPSSPDRAMQAYEEFTPLDGQFRDNVIIQIKNGPIDFQPREPFSPLFGAMPDTQQAIEFQITQEYLGASNHLVYLAPLFKECLDSDTHRGEGTIAAITSTPHKGISAIAGVANIGDDTNWCGHHFAQANWYAFGRLAWDPALSADEIADEWLGLTFTTDPCFTEPVKGMMMGSREAAVNYMMPIGLHHIFAGEHHYGPEPWYFPEGIRLDWTPLYYTKADKDGVGFDRTVATGSGAIGEYAQPLADIYEHNCPMEYLLYFHHIGWDDVLPNGKTLWQEMCDRYSTGVEQARDMQRVWDNVQPYVDAQRHREVQDKLKIQTHDAQWWKDACLLYFQDINGLPFPEDMERPVYTLDDLKKVHIPLRLHGCPTREMLP